MNPTLIEQIIDCRAFIHAGANDFYWHSFGFDFDNQRFAIYQCAECLEEIKDEVHRLAQRLTNHNHASNPIPQQGPLIAP